MKTTNILLYSCAFLAASFSPFRRPLWEQLQNGDFTSYLEPSNTPISFEVYSPSGHSFHVFDADTDDETIEKFRLSLPAGSILNSAESEEDLFHRAIEKGHFEKVKEFLRSKTLHLEYRYGFALVAAANHGSVEMIELIALHPRLYEYYKGEGMPRIHDAISRTLACGLLSAFKSILSIFDYSGDTFIRNLLSDGQTEFFSAAMNMELRKPMCDPKAIGSAMVMYPNSMIEFLADPASNELFCSRIIFAYLEAGHMSVEWSFAAGIPLLSSIEPLFNQDTEWEEARELCYTFLDAMGLFSHLRSLIAKATTEPALIDVLWEGIELQLLPELKMYPKLQDWLLMQIRAMLLKEFLGTLGGQDVTGPIYNKLRQLAFTSKH
jgi:hypothetical protein